MLFHLYNQTRKKMDATFFVLCSSSKERLSLLSMKVKAILSTGLFQ